MESTPGHGVLGRNKSLLNEKDGSSIKQDVMQSSFTVHSQLIVSRKLLWNVEIIYEKVCVSPRPPPTISFKDDCMKEMDSEVAGSSKDTQRIQESTMEIERGILLGHEDTKHSTRTVGPVGGLKSTQSWCRCLLKLMKKIKQERGDPQVDKSPPRWRSSTLTLEYQDCHMQL